MLLAPGASIAPMLRSHLLIRLNKEGNLDSEIKTVYYTPVTCETGSLVREMNSFAIGVDLGGTNLRIAAVDTTGKVLEKISTDAEVARGRDYVLDEMCNNVRALAGKFGGDGRLAGIGIGVPGIIDRQTG